MSSLYIMSVYQLYWEQAEAKMTDRFPHYGFSYTATVLFYLTLFYLKIKYPATNI